MSPFAAIVGGGAAGFFGSALAHVLSVCADRAGAEDFLRGPYGPQFFLIALYTAVFYAAIGAAAGRRAATALAGFFGPLLGIALTMAALTRRSGWGMPRGLGGTPQWQLAVVLVYTAAVWGTIAALGALSSGTTRVRGAFAAVLGSLAGYGSLVMLLRAAPSYAAVRWNPVSFLPSPVNLMDGLLSGAGLCLALSLDAKLWRNAHES
ncbi:MAG: hypothetical protein HY403_03800 [Elusimicrobia bacterium]|nr:hypothetical protein [Elusimicrobiota bacterium]